MISLGGMEMDYSKTLHLPETDFPMRGNLPKKEPGFVDFWKEHDLYHQRIEKRRKDGAPPSFSTMALPMQTARFISAMP